MHCSLRITTLSLFLTTVFGGGLTGGCGSKITEKIPAAEKELEKVQEEKATEEAGESTCFRNQEYPPTQLKKDFEEFSGQQLKSKDKCCTDLDYTNAKFFSSAERGEKFLRFENHSFPHRFEESGYKNNLKYFFQEKLTEKHANALFFEFPEVLHSFEYHKETFFFV